MALSIDEYIGKVINILVVINTDGVTSDPDPKNNFYKYVRMIDDQRNDPGQFGNELTVTCHPTDKLYFRVCAVRPDVDVQLTKFVHSWGDYVLKTISYNQNKLAWYGLVDRPGTEVYHWVVNINGDQYEWDPYIQSTNAPLTIARV